MDQKLIRKIIKINGMTCSGCELRIENALKKTEGIISVKVKFSEASASVTFDANIISLDQIVVIIEKLDYKVVIAPEKGKENGKTGYALGTKEFKRLGANEGKKTKIKAPSVSDDKITVNQFIGIGIILFAAYVVIKNTIGFNFLPNITQNMGYGLLFVVGLLTSLHCIAMCGGINLSQCVNKNADLKIENPSITNKFRALKPSLLYNSGRVVSYTIIGGIVGGIGSAITFSGSARGVVAILSGLFMLLMGLNMLNIFPWLKKFNPRMPKFFGNKIYNSSGKSGSFYVGLLNGLMPCGPLQAMQIYALGTGSILAGASSMFFFSLGTVPLMFGFGALSSLISGRFTKQMIKVSAVLVMALGIIMLNRGLGLSGINFAYAQDTSPSQSSISELQTDNQLVTTTLGANSFPPLIVQKGVPVVWDMKVDQAILNGCNGTLIIPKYNIQVTLKPGDNIIKFTPNESGDIPFTCGMGMIRSNIKVVDDITQISASDLKASDAQSVGGGMSCCSAVPQ